MASDYLLEVKNVKGECQDSKHPGTIEIRSFAWGAVNQGVNDSATGVQRAGKGSGRVVIKDITFVTEVNAASPVLMQLCWTGEPIARAVLYVRKQGQTQQDFYVVTMDDVIVTKYDFAGTDSDQDRATGGARPTDGLLPTDAFSLSFSKVRFGYREQRSDGSLGPAITVGYDLIARQKI